jgi:16S rRNA (guanine527-N7)-methyltransferase
LSELLYECAKGLGINLNSKQLNDFDVYKKLLIDWNNKFNLTSITESKDIDIKHFADSISILQFIKNKNASIIDVGTGAGFPGVPLKIANDSFSITLLDSLNKRVNFLNEVKKELNIKNMDCIHLRAEDGGQNLQLRENFDYCVSRAVAKLNLLLEYCMPFVKLGGYFIALKGPDIKEEIKEAENAVSLLGGKIEKVANIYIHMSDLNHTAVIIKKVNHTPKIYPRKAGTAAKKPL